MKIAVAGTGYVGLVTGVCLAEHGHNVTCVDVDEKKIEKMQKGISPIYEEGLPELMNKNMDRLTFTTDYKKAYADAEVIFIGVGTPEKVDGSANLKYVYTVARQIAESVERDCVVVVKSTVPIGTNDKIENYIREHLAHSVEIDCVSNPEFLSQGTAVKDTLHAARIIIGAEKEKAGNVLMKVYENFEAPKILTNRRSAEMIKYASNDFLALKISQTASRFSALAPRPYTVSRIVVPSIAQYIPVGKLTKPPLCKTWEQNKKFSAVGFRICALREFIIFPNMNLK